MTGAYLTGDGGASWRMINFGSVPTAFAFDPSRPQTLYAGAEAVYKSDDAGRTWRMVLPDPAKNTVAKPIGDHGDRVVLHRRPGLPGQRPQRHDPRDRGGRGRPGPRVGGRERRRLTGAGHAGLAHAAPRLKRRRSHVVPRREPRLGARLRAPVARRREGAARERARRDRRLRRPRAVPAARPGSRRRSLHLGQLRPRPALGRGVRLRHPAARRAGRAGPQAACRCRRTAAAPGAPRTARCSGPCAWTTAARVGAREGLAPVARADRRSRPAFRSSPTWACAASCCAGRGDEPFNGIAKTTDGGRSWSVVHAESDQPSANLSVLDRAARRGGRPLRLVRLALRPRRRAERPRRRVRHRPLPHLPDGRRRQGLGAGQLRAPGRRPLDDPRPRRHHDLRRPLRPVRREARSSSPTPTSASSAATTAARPGRAPRPASPRRGATRPTGWRSTRR